MEEKLLQKKCWTFFPVNLHGNRICHFPWLSKEASHNGDWRLYYVGKISWCILKTINMSDIRFWAYTIAGSWSTPLLENEAYFVQSPHITGFRSTFSNASSQKQMLNYFFKFNPIHRNLNYKRELLIPQNTKKVPSFWKSLDWLQNAYLLFN